MLRAVTRRPAQPLPGLDQLLDQALLDGDEESLREALMRHSGLPGARLDLALVDSFARAVGAVVLRPVPPVERLEELLDGWAGLSAEQAPGDQPEVVLVCAAVWAYGEVGAVRPDWWDDEIGKLRRAAADPRRRVREAVAQALQRLLAADRDRTASALAEWAGDQDPLVRAAAVAGPPLLGS
jgi:hypothetical protein